MGKWRLKLTVLLSYLLLYLENVSAQNQGAANVCADSDTVTLNRTDADGTVQPQSFIPCLATITHLIIQFNEFPFDCTQDTNYIKYSKAQAGQQIQKFCKEGTVNTSKDIILVNDMNTAVINETSSFGIAPTVTYVLPDATVKVYPTISYQFLNCPYGIVGTTCITTTSTSTTSTVSSTTPTTTPTTTTTTPTTSTTTSTSVSTVTTRVSTRVYDGTFCLGARDPYTGSHVIWSDTEPGYTDSKPCPNNVEGTATRTCTNNSTDPGDNVAFWELPDLSNCVSPFFKGTLTKINALSMMVSVNPISITDITSSVTAATRNDTGSVLYAGDLSAAAQTVEITAGILTKTKTDRTNLNHIIKGCSDVLSNIIDPSTYSVWKFTRKGYLENKVTTILGSVETLSANAAHQFSRMATSRRRRAVSKSDNTVVSVMNLELSIFILDRADNFTRHAVEQSGSTNENKIVLPNEVYTNAVQGTSDPYIHIYYAKFPSIANLISSTNAEIQSQRNLMEPYINSEVISSKVLNADQTLFQTLMNPVKITFTTENTSSRLLTPHCVYLNMSATTNEDRWSRTGCIRSIAESDWNTTVCYCNHLTNFAVLMDIYDVESSIGDFDAKILTYLSYGGGGLSILGCVISILIFEYFRLKSERVRIHEQLAVTIILVQLLFMVGIDRTENKDVCKALAICLHYMLVAMFCWMLVEGAHLYLVLVRVFKSRSHMKKYVLIGWGVPIILVGISAGIFYDDYGTGPICWITHKVLLVAFVPAVCLVIVINTVVLIVVMKIMFDSMSKGSKSASEERSSVKSGLKAACVLLPLLGLTWVFGFLSVTSKETLIFTYLFTFFNSTQGIFFFVFHCLLSVDVQNAYQRHNRRRSQTRLTETSFSKRTRRGSEFDTSDCSGGHRESVKTATTSVNSTLNRRFSNPPEDHNGRYSVSFDDDVFVVSPDDKLHRRSSNTTTKPINTSETYQQRISNNGTGIHGERNERHKSYVMNNFIRDVRDARPNSESSDGGGYVLYYGGNTPLQKNDIQTYSSFDKNDLYAQVKK